MTQATSRSTRTGPILLQHPERSWSGSKRSASAAQTHFVIDKSSKTAYAPIVLGHEPYGRVEQLGDGVEGPEVGSRVVIMPLITCMECDRCLAGKTRLCKQRLCIGADAEGCWADLTTVPERNVVPVPEGLSDTLAAVATDSVATSHHSVATQGRVGPGSRVAVWGSGGLGLSAVGIAKALEAESVVAVDPRKEAREWALETEQTPPTNRKRA